ncbi:aryl-sulfate sulfotransferase [Pseudomonas sp. OG7]|uniref:aryl-sulfate sulfotransferase n=1 Tax=Pseudomonas sp. OG7 TaxID=2587037 RepID=UPI0021A3EE82|nr:aryl-sulfate sulfotransferase [Pseudomonas sp. OG7]
MHHCSVGKHAGLVEPWQIWEYGKERGDDWYSPITSVVDYRPDTNTHLIYSASVNYLTREKLTRPVLTEVRYGTQEVLSEFRVRRDSSSLGHRM